MANNFTDKQREMWRLAQYAADRTRRKSENFERPIIIPPDWYYRQWVHEAGNNFDSEMARLDNNYGGLKDTKGNFRGFISPTAYADAFVDDFILLRPELSDAKTMDDYVRIMHETGYMTNEDDPPAYLADMKNVIVPDDERNFSNVQGSLLNLNANPPQQNYSSNADYSPSLRNQFMQQGNQWADILSQMPQQQIQQVQQPPTRPSTSSLLNLPSYQNTPQVNMSRWTPYNNVQFTQQGTQNRDNFVAGVRNWARNLFGGRSE